MAHRVILGRKLHPAGQALLDARPDIAVTTLADPAPPELRRHLAEADAVLCWLERIGPEELAAAPRLKVVSRYGVGFDTIDVAACTARRIPVMVVNGSNDLSVAEHAMMLMLAVARRAADTDRLVKAGGWWPEGGPDSIDLAGRNVLVVGYGRIGARVAAYCRAFQLRVAVLDHAFHPARIAADGYHPARDLHRALAEADVVTLHCPLTPTTRHLMDDAAFAALKPGAILINTARGGLVDEAALLRALAAGRLFGAGLDVLEQEPPPPDAALLRARNVVLSPHTAASTAEGLARMARQAARNILDALDGHPDPAMMVDPTLAAG
jgi:D-3-phosphoglycerate dehydrogenase